MEVESHHLHPHPIPNPHHRKIELQSPLDLTFLQDNLANTAQQKLDLHFPPSALRKPPAQPATFISLDGADASHQPQLHPQSLQQQLSQEEIEHDPLRAKVHSIVSSFLQRTWSSASQNITINGLDASSFPSTAFPPSSQQPSTDPESGETEREGVDFTYTPYDSRLQQYVASLYGELEALTAQVSKLRREAPRTGAETYAQRLREEMETEEREFEREQQEILEQQGQEQSDDVLRLDKVREGYYEDMQATYAQGVGELARLAGVSKNSDGGGGGGSLTETVGKVQRARTVAMELE
jgi:kinetochor protein Mis14/NSL1